MKNDVNVLVADDDMLSIQLMCDVLEINFRNLKIEHALSVQSFWAKIRTVNGANPWNLIFLTVEYIKEAPEGFLERVREANPEAPGKIIITDPAAGLELCGDDIRRLPLLIKPFSLDGFEEMVKAICG